MTQQDLSVEQVVSTLRGSRFVMLTTATTDRKLVSHPMTPQQVTDGADVWFFIGLDTDHAEALRGGAEVNIAVSESGSWLSVAGRAEFVADRSKVEELWDDEAASYFAQGKNDPHLGLLRVSSESAQYWGMSGGKVTALTSILKARLTGEPVEGVSGTTEL